jgi:signal transduction histidine kinase
MIAGFVILALLIFIFCREIYFRKKLWYHETFVNELPFDSIMMDEKWRFRIISGSAVKDPVKRRWMIGKTEMDYWVKQRKDLEIGKKRLAMFEKALNERQLVSLEETMTDKNGEERVYLRMIKPVFNTKNGHHIGLVGFTYELTAIKQKERELEELNKELLRSNEDLNNFAHVASHDLKTPLRSIVSFIQLYERKNRSRFDDTDKEYIKFISNSATQMNSLINSLLSYSSIQAQKEDAKPVNLDKILDSVQSNFRSIIIERQVDLKISPMPTIMAHDFLMLQLFQNLIGNGIKYNKSASPTIETFILEDKNGITFCVRDNGIGIPAEYQERVFKVFQRLHGVGNFEGTGIGLAACKRIIELYEGKIWFESTVGVGTTFYFKLPTCTVIEQAHTVKFERELVA